MKSRTKNKILFITLLTIGIITLFPATANAGILGFLGDVGNEIKESVAHVIERGIGWFIVAIATGLLLIVEKGMGLTLVGIISQGTMGPKGDGLKYVTINVPDATGRITIGNIPGSSSPGVFDSVIATYYPVAYNLAIIMFMVIICYIGLQTLFSTASAKREEYMERMKAWFFGIIMLFAFNFVMIYTIKANNYLASFFLTVGKVDTTTVQSANSGQKQSDDEESIFEPEDPLLKDFFYAWYNSKDNMGGICGALIYLGAASMVFWLFSVYAIRMFYVTFLIILFPVVMAVYCIDKLDDNKSKVFQEWWVHFISFVFTNSIHALTLGIIYTTVIAGTDVPALIKLFTLFAFFPANKLAREIFGLERGGQLDFKGAGLIAGILNIGKNLDKNRKKDDSSSQNSNESRSGESPGFRERISNAGQAAKEKISSAKDYYNKKGAARTALRGAGLAVGLGAAATGKMAIAGAKVAGGLGGATMMLATGQGLNDAIGGAFLGSKLYGNGMTSFNNKAQGAVGAGMGALENMADNVQLRNSISDRDDVHMSMYGDGNAYHDADGNILHFEYADNSEIEGVQANANISDGRLNNLDQAGATLRFNTNANGTVTPGSINVSAQSVNNRVNADPTVSALSNRVDASLNNVGDRMRNASSSDGAFEAYRDHMNQYYEYEGARGQATSRQLSNQSNVGTQGLNQSRVSRLGGRKNRTVYNTSDISGMV